MTRRFKLTLEYDGGSFYGWQRQPGVRTVQGELERALATFYQRSISVHGQGRTDRGVHAAGQVAHADLPDNPPAARLVDACRSLLPSDIGLLDIREMSGEFHARFDAVARIYEYRLVTRRSPLNRRYAWQFPYPLDRELLQSCAESLTGDHDFVNFAKLVPGHTAQTRCSVTESEWKFSDHYNTGPIQVWTYRIRANRFLRHMVRRLVGTMVGIASGRLEREELVRLLQAGAAGAKGHAAPAAGLVLLGVVYDKPEDRPIVSDRAV